MKATIFVRSYWKDFPWLHFCLRSIEKFCTGFDVKLCVPNQSLNFLPQKLTSSQQRHSISSYVYDPIPGKGMMQSMLCALEADIICPNSDYIFFVDCDCIFTQPVTPDCYTNDGKIILPVTSYADLRESESGRQRAELWQPAMKAALGYAPVFSTMHRIPVVHHRSVFEACRRQIRFATGMPDRDYLLSLPNEFPWKFSEFEALGCVAMNSVYYEAVDAEAIDPRIPGIAGGQYSARFKNVNCYWSHGGISPQIRAEMEGILQ